MKTVTQRISSRLYLILPLSIIALYIAPLIYFGESSRVLIHDNLDSNIIYFKVLAESGQIFGTLAAVIPNIMNGLPRNIYGSEFNVILWLYYFFEPYTAIVINQILMRLIAFVGMFLLLKKHFMEDKNSELVAIGVALTFSLLPFWPSGGLSVAGQPLVLYAFLNIRASSQSLKDWFIISLIPFYASLVLSFVFFITAISLLWLYDWIVDKKINLHFLFSIILISIIFLFVEYRLVYTMFFDNSYISHRSVWVPKGYGLIEALKRSWGVFRYGQYHAHSLHQYFIILSLIMASIVALVKSLKIRLIVGLLFIIIVTSGIYGLWSWRFLMPLKETIGILSSFQFGRFHFLQPLLWYIVFALCLNLIYKHIPKFGKTIVIGFIVMQSLFLFYHHDQIQQRSGPSFDEFFSTNLFEEIDSYIGREKESYRVVSIGIHPSVSQYNGFYTLDGYISNYPLEYKYQFRKIIEKELDKNVVIREHFDGWGSRCYLYTAELGRNNMVDKNSELQIERLEITSDILYEMDGRYIFSAVEILNYKENNLKLLKIFESEQSLWRIYLYEVKPSNQTSSFPLQWLRYNGRLLRPARSLG